MRTLLAVGLALPVLASGAEPLPTVVILSTGGTIASRYDAAQGGLVPALSGDELVEAVPELTEHAQVHPRSHR